MCNSENLFAEYQNTQTFARMCMACGPKVDEDIEFNSTAPVLDKVFARALTESVLSQLVVAGLIAARESGRKIELSAATRVFTPPASEYEVGRAVTVENEEGAEV
jgi:hypothetical protein